MNPLRQEDDYYESTAPESNIRFSSFAGFGKPARLAQQNIEATLDHYMRAHRKLAVYIDAPALVAANDFLLAAEEIFPECGQRLYLFDTYEAELNALVQQIPEYAAAAAHAKKTVARLRRYGVIQLVKGSSTLWSDNNILLDVASVISAGYDVLLVTQNTSLAQAAFRLVKTNVGCKKSAYELFVEKLVPSGLTRLQEQ